MRSTEAQVNYLNLKHNLAKKIIVISKISEEKSLIGNCRIGAAKLQTLTTIRLKNYEYGNKKSSKKAVFSRWKFSKNSTESSFTQPQGRMGTENILRIVTRHTLGACFELMQTTVKLSQIAKNLFK